MNMTEIIDWILRITGIISFVNVIINVIYKEYFICDNAHIIDNPSKEELDNYLHLFDHNDIETQTIEKTLFVSVNSKVKKLKLYNIKHKKGKFLRGKIIKEVNNIEPEECHLFYISRGCAMPLYILEWTMDYGIKANYVLKMGIIV